MKNQKLKQKRRERFLKRQNAKEIIREVKREKKTEGIVPVWLKDRIKQD